LEFCFGSRTAGNPLKTDVQDYQSGTSKKGKMLEKKNMCQRKRARRKKTNRAHQGWHCTGEERNRRLSQERKKKYKDGGKQKWGGTSIKYR